MDIKRRNEDKPRRLNRKAKRMLNEYLGEIAKWRLVDRISFAWKVLRGKLYE
jgi:hypothetical protein